MSAKPAGCSGTPLARKLGISEGSRVHVRGAPESYAGLKAVGGSGDALAL
jgi:hypothetical protein